VCACVCVFSHQCRGPRRFRLRKNGPFFECFPYVCSEPVLVKCSFLYRNGSKRPFLLARLELSFLVIIAEDVLGMGVFPGLALVPLQETRVSFRVLSLCLSRAWLGKMIHFCYETASQRTKNAFFTPSKDASQSRHALLRSADAPGLPRAPASEAASDKIDPKTIAV
jgi:hypothetical protein